MLNYFKILCQTLCVFFLNVFFVHFFASCSLTEEKNLEPAIGKAVWFNHSDKNYTYFTDERDVRVHPFFDLMPFIEYESNLINFVPITTAESKFAYGFDFVSGERYQLFSYCEQGDVWGRDYVEIDRPPFTIGIVPRMLNSKGLPQKIIVFGNEHQYRNEIIDFNRSYRVKVIGGLIEEYCNSNTETCSRSAVEERLNVLKGGWERSIVLVAVDPHDIEYGRYNSLQEIKIERDKDKEKKDIFFFDMIKHFLENGQGKIVSGVNKFLIDKHNRRDNVSSSPAYRITSELDSKDVLRKSVREGNLLSFQELFGLRENCIKLYEKLWKDFDGSLIESTSSKNISIKANDFKKIMLSFFELHGKAYGTCSRYVKYSYPHNERNRDKLLLFVDAFYKAHTLGYGLMCTASFWTKENMSLKKLSDGSIWKEYANCTGEEIQRGLVKVLELFANLRGQEMPFYRYLDYDNIYGGSHKELYSWVYYDGKLPHCKNINNMNFDFFKHKIFPSDNIDLKRVFYTEESIQAGGKRDRVLILHSEEVDLKDENGARKNE